MANFLGDLSESEKILTGKVNKQKTLTREIEVIFFLYIVVNFSGQNSVRGADGIEILEEFQSHLVFNSRNSSRVHGAKVLRRPQEIVLSYCEKKLF